MRLLKQISEDEMIAAFLKGEINSKRFGLKIHKLLSKYSIDINIIINADVTNNQENRLRKKMLSEYRGYGKNIDLFEKFPVNIMWYKAVLTKRDLNKIQYIDYSYWNKLSKGTRLVKDGAESVKEGIEIFNVSNKYFYEVFEKLRKGFLFPEIILIAENEKSNPIILEGHVRLTAMLINSKYIPEKLEVIMGLSNNLCDWK